MSEKSEKKVLIVDDDADICEALGMLLEQEGYAITTASDGFQALTQIGLATPDVIVCDLNMPRMSGHEFLCVVRQRFASIPVIAMSGDYDSSQRFPGGVIADAFFAKGRRPPEELLSTLTTLLESPPSRPGSQPAAVQTPRCGTDSKGAAFMLLTCGECLRSFQTGAHQPVESETRQASCPFCHAQVHYAGGYPKYLPVSSAAPQAVSPTQRSTVAA